MKTNRKESLGQCIISGGAFYDYFFSAYVWLEYRPNEAPEFMELERTPKIKLRLTKKNESSVLIKTWKEDLSSSETLRLTLGISISTIKESNHLSVASVYPEKIEGRYLYLSIRANRLGELWSVT